jgi:peptidoglycan/LPS O-acetylase OafA/YrhL
MTAGLNLGIQGLRGIAIALVLLNHAGVPGFAGGYVGVDIFFVISGYLIGGLLWREATREGRIRIWDFYARRIRRLLPAHVLLVMAVGLASLLCFAPEEWDETFSAMRASLLYAINLWFTGRATDYFATHAAANPFLHLWSLAVEEQFYLVFPWLVVLCLKAGADGFTRRLWWVMLAAGAASLVACVAVTWINQPLAFFNMPFRMWEFAAGIALALRPVALSAARSALLGGMAATGLLAITLWMDERRQFPGLWAVLPVLCAQGLLLAVIQPGPNLLKRALSWTPLVRLGDCSYSVYLWHWPLLIFAAVLWPQRGALVTVAVVLASVAAGWASWCAVEERWRTRWAADWRPARFVLMSGCVVLGLTLLASIPRHWPSDDDQRDIARQRLERPKAVVNGCHAAFSAVDLPECVFGALDGAQTVVLWGDSHAASWFPALEAVAMQNHWRLVSLTKSACPSVDIAVWNQPLRRFYTECDAWREAMFRRIAALRPALVVLTNLATYEHDLTRWQTGLDATLAMLEAEGLATAVIRDSPRVPVDVATCAARARWRGGDINDRCAFASGDRRPWLDDVARVQADVLARRATVLSIDLSQAFCTAPTCPVADGKRLRFYDDNHLTPAFAASLSSVLAERIATAAAAAGNRKVAELFAPAPSCAGLISSDERCLAQPSIISP